MGSKFIVLNLNTKKIYQYNLCLWNLYCKFSMLYRIIAHRPTMWYKFHGSTLIFLNLPSNIIIVSLSWSSTYTMSFWSLWCDFPMMHRIIAHSATVWYKFRGSTLNFSSNIIRVNLSWLSTYTMSFRSLWCNFSIMCKLIARSETVRYRFRGSTLIFLNLPSTMIIVIHHGHLLKLWAFEVCGVISPWCTGSLHMVQSCCINSMAQFSICHLT